jgi:hypothetical protein
MSEIKWFTNLGDIKKYVIKQKTDKRMRLYLFKNQYIIMYQYKPLIHYVELIKNIVGINCINISFCNLVSKLQIAYESFPYYDYSYSNTELLKKTNINDEERNIYIFHWILGIRGKIMIRLTKDGYFYYSSPPYNCLNLEIKQFTKNVLNKLFSGLSQYDEIKRIISSLFNLDKLEKIYYLLVDKNFEWYTVIKKRINLFISDLD